MKRVQTKKNRDDPYTAPSCKGDISYLLGVEHNVAEHGQDDLLARLRDPTIELFMEERTFIADTLAGKIKRAPHRPARAATKHAKLSIAAYVIHLRLIEQDMEKAAVSLAAEEFGKAERTIRSALAFARAYRSGAWWRGEIDRQERLYGPLRDCKEV